MKKELANYTVTPKIVLAGVETEITIRPRGPHAMFKDNVFQAWIIPMRMSREPEHDYDVIKLRVSDDGCLRLKYTFKGEQEFKLRLYKEDVNLSDPKAYKFNMRQNFLLCFRIYSLFEDLYARRPYKGDFHVHSTGSDGSECPEITAANYRKNGFDFYALTDHLNYSPSVQCKAYYDTKPVDFKVFHGEEVHSPGNSVHIVNFGSRYSINELFQKNPETYDREVRQIMDTIDIPAGIKGYEYAACLWVFRKIREAGGLAINVHPHWMYDAYYVPDILSDALFASGEFDVFELLSGHELHSNNLQTAYYNDKRAGGISPVIVGASDSHGSEPENNWFNWVYSIVLSKGLELADIKEAVMAGYTGAVDKYPGEQARVHGPYRMTLYTRFLLEEYFPLHEELCFEEGRLMKEMFLGDGKAEELLKMMRGRTDALLKQYWGC